MIIKTQQTQSGSANVISKSKFLQKRRQQQEQRTYNRSQAEEEQKYLEGLYASGKKLNPKQIEQLKQSSDYEVEYYDDGKTVKSIKSKPVKYSRSWESGRGDEYDYYRPVEMYFDRQGNLDEKKVYQLDSRSGEGYRDTKPFISKEESYDDYGWKTGERFYKTRDWDNQLVKEYKYESGQMTYKQNWGTDFKPQNQPTGTGQGTNNPEYKPKANSQFRQRNGTVEYFDPNKGKWISSRLPEKTTGTTIYTATIGGKTYQTPNKEWLTGKQKEFEKEYKSSWESSYSATSQKILNKQMEGMQSKPQGYNVFTKEIGGNLYASDMVFNTYGQGFSAKSPLAQKGLTLFDAGLVKEQPKSTKVLNKSMLLIGDTNDNIRSIGNNSVLDYSIFHPTINLVDNTQKKEEGLLKNTAKRYGQKWLDIGSNVVTGTGKILQSGVNYVGEFTFYIPRDKFLGGQDINLNTLSTRLESKVKEESKIFQEQDVQTTLFVGGLAWGSSQFALVKTTLTWAFRGIGAYNVYKFTKEPTSENLAESLFYLTPDIIRLGKKPVQFLRTKVDKGYVPFEKTGVQVVEDVTIPTKLKTLRGYEGKTVPTVHTTLSTELKPNTVITPAPEGSLSSWRANVGQKNFYSSSPQPVVIEKLVDGKWVTSSFQGTPIQPRYQPVVYGGYIGIGQGYSDTNIDVSILPKPAKAFIFRETTISMTPASISEGSLKQVVKYQTTNAGTYVAGENIKGVSIEGQFTTSSGLEGNPLMKIVPKEGILSGKFTYYNLKKPIPKILGGENAPPIVKNIFNFLTSENKPISFYEVGFEKIASSTPTSSVVDLGSYGSTYGSKSVAVSSVTPLSLGASQLIKASKPTSSQEISKSVSKSFPSYSSTPISSSSISKISSSSIPSSVSSSISKISSPSKSKSSSSSSSVSSSISSSLSSSSSSSSSVSSSISSSLSSSSSSSSSVSSSISSSLSSSSSKKKDSSIRKYGYPTPSDDSKKKQPRFETFVKRRGKFESLGLFETPREAILKGKFAVDKTASASFKVEGSRPDIERSALQLLPRNVFTRSKKDSEIFVQRRGKRISSGGEKREITFKGLNILRQGRARKSFNRFNIFG